MQADQFYSRLLLAFVVLACSFLACTRVKAEQPNVLFIAVDDLNDWAAYRGCEQVISPNMDQLASEGVWFSRAYCQYPVCGPSRASVMSGMYFHQLGSNTLQMKDQDVAKTVQKLNSQLLHSYFKMHGYKTMAVGKLLHRHLSEEGLDFSGGRGGWGTIEDEHGKRVKINFKSQATLTDWAYSRESEAEMSDSLAAQWAVERLKEEHNEPFMLMVGFLRPHVPWYVPKQYFDLYDPSQLSLPAYLDDDLEDVPEAARDTINEGYPRTQWAIEGNHWRNILQAYLASITFVDNKIGHVLAALKRSPYHNNTIVVLWSDHGYHMGEKNTFQKHTLWERSARVPLVVKLPQSMRDEMNAQQCDRVVSLIDLYPTLVDLCGLPENRKVMGRSLRPLIKDPQQSWSFPSLTYRKDGGKSIRDERYRFIEYGDGSTELYDHESDPNEWKNLAGHVEHAKILKRMQQTLTQYHRD